MCCSMPLPPSLHEEKSNLLRALVTFLYQSTLYFIHIPVNGVFFAFKLRRLWRLLRLCCSKCEDFFVLHLTRRLFALGLGALAFAAPVAAQPRVMSAQEASRAVAAGEIVLIDIRTPDEWRESGVALGAWPIDMVSKDFSSRMQALLKAEAGKPIAIICATGGRTQFLQKVIAQNGLGEVVDVGEGMYGSRHGQGWLKENLPLARAEAALAAMPEAYRAAK